MKFFLIVILCFPAIVYSQVVSEDFENGLGQGWIQYLPGRWSPDTTNSINGQYSLHHIYDNPSSGSDFIGFSLSGLQPALGETAWSFKIRHGYNPSSLNNWSVFLMSDASPEEISYGTKASGYVLGVNYTGYNDTLCLWKTDHNNVTEIIRTKINWQNDIGPDSAVNIYVSRSIDGEWQIYTVDNSNNRHLAGSGVAPELFTTAWFVVKFSYSSSQDRKLWMDDIILEGIIYTDRESPVLDTIRKTGNRKFDLVFNEPVADNPDCWLLPGEYTPVNIDHSGNSISITFGTGPVNKSTYSIQFQDICDLSGNCTDTVLENIEIAWPELTDIIITEVMADPDPAVRLPTCEYIEIYNNTEFDFFTGELELLVGDELFEIDDIILQNGEYIIITDKEEIHELSYYGKTITTSKNLHLNNSQDLIALLDREENLIHGIEYSSEWFYNSLKKTGGWSLEIIDPEYPFSGANNWSGSSDKRGGSPGTTNSVNGNNPDLDNPVAVNIYPLNKSLLSIYFSETINDQAFDIDNWTINNNEAVEARIYDPINRAVVLQLKDSLEENTIYELSVKGNITDIAGNELLIHNNRFGIPLSSRENDIIINEVLYDPLPGDPEFIEIYNRSDRVIDLSDHFIVSYNSESSDTGIIKWLSDYPRCLLPGEFYVITTDRDLLIQRFTSCAPNRIFEIKSLPSMPDRAGGLLLFNRNLELMDKMIYSDDMHFGMLSVTTGISLERVYYDRPGTDMDNWRSAAGTSAFGTPGITNSCYSESNDIENGSTIELSSKRISPDNDGYQDYLDINLFIDSENAVFDAEVYNDIGYKVRTLANNMTSGYTSKITWDALDNVGNYVREGIYIIFIRIISPGRSPEVIKKVCTVVYN